MAMNKILRYILLIFALGISLEMQSQSSGPATVSFSKDKNYVATLTPRNGVSSVACNNGTISNYESGNVQVSICYMDGLGRPGAAGGIPHFACGKGSDKHAGVRFP